MNLKTFRFQFARDVALSEAEQTLHLALYAVGGLFGEARVRLEGAYHIDEERSTISVDASTEVGAAVVKIYAGLLLKEFGEGAFQVRPISTTTPSTTADQPPGENADVHASVAV